MVKVKHFVVFYRLDWDTYLWMSFFLWFMEFCRASLAFWPPRRCIRCQRQTMRWCCSHRTEFRLDCLMIDCIGVYLLRSILTGRKSHPSSESWALLQLCMRCWVRAQQIVRIDERVPVWYRVHSMFHTDSNQNYRVSILCFHCSRFVVSPPIGRRCHRIRHTHLDCPNKLVQNQWLAM